LIGHHGLDGSCFNGGKNGIFGYFEKIVESPERNLKKNRRPPSKMPCTKGCGRPPRSKNPSGWRWKQSFRNWKTTTTASKAQGRMDAHRLHP
jgi:hypothetical protein